MQHGLLGFAVGAVALLMAFGAQAMTPLEECAPSTVPMVCLDAKLKQANLRLNAALKSATARIEELQKKGERLVMGAFVDSQRQFNGYRDLNCGWQGIGVPRAQRAAAIKDCQIRATLAREQELLAFASGATVAAEPGLPEPEVTREDGVESVAMPESPASAEPAAPAQDSAPAAESAARPGGREWRLQSWSIDGAEQRLMPDSLITVAFDPSGKVSGSGSVNRYAGTFRFDQDGRLVWPPGGFTVTKMAGPAALMKQERAFLAALRRMTAYRSEGSRLMLESASGRTVMTFARD
jgi:heat shock protein HslJ/uncharacterized protein YecT (DUF1311 family)